MAVSSTNITLTPRDDEILTDLYFTRILSTRQIAAKHFNSLGSATRRMHDLKKMGMVTHWNPWKGFVLWTLTRKAFAREIEALRRKDETHKGFPKPRIAPHFIDTNDVFIELSPKLDRMLSEHPAWEWKDEARMPKRGRGSGSTPYEKQPDAEIVFCGNRYFLERQTSRARATRGEIEEKIEGHRRYIHRLREPTGEIEVLFACDEERDMDYAYDAAQKHQVKMTSGSPEQIVEHLEEKARAHRSKMSAANA